MSVLAVTEENDSETGTLQVSEGGVQSLPGWRQLPLPGRVSSPGHLGVSLAEHSHFGRILPSSVPGMGFRLTTAIQGC